MLPSRAGQNHDFGGKDGSRAGGELNRDFDPVAPTQVWWPTSQQETEAVGADSPFRGPLTGLDDVKTVTLARSDWYNQRRHHHRLGPIPPAE